MVLAVLRKPCPVAREWYNLREIIDHIDELRFRSQTEKHELSHLYEAKIKNMGIPAIAAASSFETCSFSLAPKTSLTR
jgi:hypothetical protein